MTARVSRVGRWRVAGVVIAAAATGVLATKPLLAYLIDRQAIHNGPWRTSVSTGRSTANPWERAAVAVAGLYALTPDEAVYYTALTDSAGRPLRGECRYQLVGRPPPARWWSVTAYGEDHYLVPNPQQVYARSAANLPASADGRVAITLAAGAVGPSALPVPASGPYSLTLRLYNPAAEVLAQLARVELPAILRTACP